ncbi:MAG: hypothetical protein H6926_00815 [Chromatiales bacterium]|nr:hypothetical protein [Chromatiales bacterium]
MRDLTPSPSPCWSESVLSGDGQKQTVESIATPILELKSVANERGAVLGVDKLDNPSKKRHLQMIVWRATGVGSDADRLHNTIEIAVGYITRTASAMIEEESAKIQSVSVIGTIIFLSCYVEVGCQASTFFLAIPCLCENGWNMNSNANTPIPNPSRLGKISRTNVDMRVSWVVFPKILSITT